MRALVDLLVFSAFLVFEGISRSLPPRLAVALADGIGDLWFALDRRHRHRAEESVRVALRGGLRVPDPEGLPRASFRSLARVPLEVLLLPRLFRHATDWLHRCRFHGDFAALKADIEDARGGVFFAGHLGNWEVAGWGLSFLHVPFRVVARPIENRWIDERAARHRGGETGVIPKAGAARAILRCLRDGLWVGVVGDQNAGRHGVFVPFFGLPASTHRLPAALAVRTGVPVYAGACLRRRDRLFAYDLHLVKLHPPPEGSEEERARGLLAQMSAWLETWTRLAPEQYNWMHRRWKTRPAGEAPGPHRPDYAES